VVVAFYLVERYVPSMTAAELAAAVVRLGELPTAEVRHVWTVLVGDEDTCLSVFEATDAAAVEDANARADFHFDRVVAVTSFAAAPRSRVRSPAAARTATGPSRRR
jgi:hypothetical protein